MAYINNTKFKEIFKASKEGNEKAKEILQAIRKNGSQGDLDRLLEEFYKIPVAEEEQPMTEDVAEQEIPAEVVEDEGDVKGDVKTEVETTNEEPMEEATNEVKEQAEDISSILDKEFDGLVDENNLDEISFADYLGNKKRDGIRSKKNADYFKAYAPEAREAYMNNKIDSYKNKFNTRLKDIDRHYKDVDNAINTYSGNINTLLDDDVELDMGKVNDAYNDLTENEPIMHGFGRVWDEDDTNEVVNALKELISKYGKKNVISALNTLKNDNSNYRDYLTNQIDTEISRYSKNIEGLLK